MERKRFLSMAVFMLALLVTQGQANALTIEWADFSQVSGYQPLNGTVSSSGGGLSFDVNFYGWTGNDTNLSIGAAATTNGLLDWSGGNLLHGQGRTSYSVEFDNISSHDGSLYFGAVWLYSGHPITIRAYNLANQQINLSGTALAGTFYGNGITSWNGATGQLTTYGGTGSDHGGIVDLSNLGIDRLLLTYNTATWDGFNFGLASTVPMNNPVPEPATILLFGVGLVGITGFRKKK